MIGSIIKTIVCMEIFYIIMIIAFPLFGLGVVVDEIFCFSESCQRHAEQLERYKDIMPKNW